MKGKLVGASAIAMALAGTLIARWEGTKFEAYQDVGGVWTICEGHTEGVKPGMKASQTQCDEWRNQDIAKANEIVDRCILTALTDNQRAAFIDAAYNAGPKILCGSTLQRKANTGDIKGACYELRRWIHADGKPWKGLINRRADELALCWPNFSNVVTG